MIELTEQQRQELKDPEPRARDPETGATYVLVKAEVYERLRALLDETELATAELVDRVMAEDDANDPNLAEYQRRYGGDPP